MLLFKQFSTIIGNKSYLDNGNFQWDMTVHENSVELVMSNVFNILCTPYGTQPLLRTFGLSSSWIDQPGSIGLMQAKIAALLSISLWEPRAIVRDFEFFLNPSDIMAGLYSVAIEIEVDLRQTVQTILFAPPAPASVWVLDAPFDASYPTPQQETITL